MVVVVIFSPTKSFNRGIPSVCRVLERLFPLAEMRIVVALP